MHRSGADSRHWHDTNGADADIPLWKDPMLVLNYEKFWSTARESFAAYKVKAASEETIRNFSTCITSCSARIQRERDPERAAEILRNLGSVVDMLREDRQYRFSWNCRLYRNPPRMGPRDFDISMEELARVEEVCRDKARERLLGEVGVRIERVPSLIELSEFVIVCTSNVEGPFYVAQVSETIP